jgi:hypothetical protein
VNGVKTLDVVFVPVKWLTAPPREINRVLWRPGLPGGRHRRGRKDSLQSFGHTVRLEPIGAGGAFVSDPAVLSDHKKPVRPRGVGIFGGVPQIVNHGRDLDTQLGEAGACHGAAFISRLRTGHPDLVCLVVLILPGVDGMGLLDVNHVERHPVFVLVIQFIQGRNLPPERRSGVATEDEHHGLAAAE